MSLKYKKYNCNLKPLSLGVSLALSSFATMAADSPFAIAPQHLSSTATVKKTTVTTPYAEIHKQQQSVTNTTVRGMQGAKPNIMLLLDDSGSMREIVPGSGRSRQQILQDSLPPVINRYGSQINWGLVSFNNPSSSYNLSLGTHYSTVANAIRNFPIDGTTPTITSYLKAVDMLNKGIKYRCQKSYVVLLSDGDSNWPMNFWITAGLNRNTGYKGSKVYNFLYYPHWVYINSELNKYPFWRDLLTKDNKLIDKSSPKYRGMCSTAYQQSNSNAKNWCSELPQKFIYYPYNGVSDYSINSDLDSSRRVSTLNFHSPTRYTEAPLRGLTSDLDFLGSESAYYTTSNPNRTYGYGGGYVIFNYQPILTSQAKYAGEMLSFFSEPINRIDLRTERTDGNDATGKSWDDPAFPTQNITTFTIGFGNGLTSSGLALLRGGASNIKLKNGTVQKAYYSASDQTSLTNAFNSILDQVHAENPPPSNSNPIDLPPTTNTLPISAPIAGTPNRQQSVMAETSYATSPPSATGASNSIPNMAASVFVPAGLKSSELRFYTLNSKAQADTSSWRVADFSQRKALISTGSGVVRWANDASLNNTFFLLSTDTQTPQRTDEWNKALLPWITRVTGSDDSKIRAMNYPTPYRIRPVPPTDSPRNAGVDEYNMGDVLDTPIVATGKNGIEQGNRQEFLITAANDGMVYLFQSNPDVNAKNPYSLKLNYLPATMPRQTLSDTHATHYKDLANENYAKDSARPHLFMINGGITVRTTSAKSNRQNTFMVGALGQGGRGMYALNIGGKALDSGNDIGLNAEDSTWNTSVPLYESNPNNVNSTEFSSLGYTVGYPQIGRVAIKHNADGSLSDNSLKTGVYYASFLSSGFSSPNGSQETALYIQDALGVDVGGGASTAATANGNTKGKLLAKVVVPGGVGGLASPTLLDVNRDGVYDFVFAGDYGGNMYRFDLRKIDLSDGTVTDGAVKKIYSGSETQPITSAPAISMQKNGRYVVAFGTGSDMYARDYNSTAEQAVYGIYQRFNTSNLDPIDINNPTAAEAAEPLTADNLLEQTLTTKVVEMTDSKKMVTVRDGSTNAIEDPNDKSKLAYSGWKVLLGNTTSVQDGERVVVTPTVIFGTLILSTRIYKEKPITTVNNNDWSENNWQTDGWVKVSEKFDQNHTELQWSPWKNISTNSTSTTNSGDICTGTVNTSTTMQERERKVNYETITTYEKVQPSENQSSGWILALNATNGGAVKVSSGTGVDFLGKYASNFNPNDPAHSNTYFTVGLYSSTGLPNHTLLTNDSNINGLGSAMTRDGEAKTNGEDGDLKPGGETAKDDCFNAADGSYVLTGNTATGIGETFGVVGRRCSKKMQIRRLSWREIF